MKSENFGYVLFLSVVAAIGGILFGYDTAVISGTIASVCSKFSLDTMQQGWFVGCALIGSIAGMCVPYILNMWRLVPETTGKTLEEIENYWKTKA